MFQVWMNQNSRVFRWDWWYGLQRLFEKPESQLLRLGRSLLGAVLVVLVGRKLIKLLVKLLERTFQRANVEEGVAKFLLSLCRILFYVVLVVILMHILGLETSSLVALVASAGLTVGLALQGSLSNFAGGVLILLLKPFRVGDYIMALGNEGTVTGIDVFYTRLLTGDNKVVVIPNGTLSNSSIVNVTNEEVRRLDLSVSVAYTEDVQKVKNLLNEVITKNEMVLKEKGVNVYIDDFNSNTITIGIRLWVMVEDYWTLKCNLLEEMKKEFDINGIVMAS